MGKLVPVIILGLACVIGYIGLQVSKDGEAPQLPEDYYWGPSLEKGNKEDESIHPFKISISEKVLNDLKSRLKSELSIESGLSRYVKPLENTGSEYGINANFLQKVGMHWMEKYNWNEREKKLNQYAHFQTKISGLNIHFLHVKSNNNKNYKTTKPLLLIHGWPGSFVEFYKVIPMFIDPSGSDFNFELIIPSIPGYGFSEGSHVPGLGAVEVAQIFHKLMKRLNLKDYYIQGGDWGSVITSHMASLYPNEVKGVHQNMCNTLHPKSVLKLVIATMFPKFFLDQEDLKRPSMLLNFGLAIRETGYLHIQATKPDSVGASLSQSPTGLAAYILEKFSSWTDMDLLYKEDGSSLTQYFSLDELLDNVMIYWVTNSITTSMRLYSESMSPRQKEHGMDRVPIKIPSACLALRREPYSWPRFVLSDKYQNLIRYTNIDKGGHFGAFEIPELFSKDVIQFVKQVEQLKK